MKKLQSIEITDQSQVEIMREIYNDNLEFLATYPLPYRTYDAQQVWWNENSQFVDAYLYQQIEQPCSIVGFLVLRKRHGFKTPIFALNKSAWGKGYGKEIILDYIGKAGGPMAGSQLKSNKAICHLNEKLGWRVLGERTEETGDIQLLFHPGMNISTALPPDVKKAIGDYLKITNTDAINQL